MSETPGRTTGNDKRKSGEDGISQQQQLCDTLDVTNRLAAMTVLD